MENEHLLKKLVRSRNELKKKFQSIKMGEDVKTVELNRTFKPITEELQKLVQINSENIPKYLIHNAENVDGFKEHPHTSTPNKSYIHEIKEDKIKPHTPEEDDFNLDYTQYQPNNYNETRDETFYSENDDEDMENMNISFLKQINKLDTVYGPHKDINGEWKFGDKPLKMNNEKIIIGNQHWALTPGLFELLFHQKPKNYDASELEIYKKILFNSNAYKVDYNPNERVKPNKGYKYKNIIKKLIGGTHSEDGLMKVNLAKPEYVYWHDPNVLVERLKLLLELHQSGNDDYTNEIVSIIEELREADIIY